MTQKYIMMSPPENVATLNNAHNGAGCNQTNQMMIMGTEQKRQKMTKM